MKRRVTFAMKMFKKLSREFDYTFILNWENGDFGYLDFSNGIRHYVSRTDIRINRIGAFFVAGNKYYTDIFLKKYGYPVIKSDIFFSESYCRDNDINQGLSQGIKFAEKINYPVIIKPNDGLHGNGVQKILSKKELRRGLLQLFKNNDKVLVQKFAEGDDYRIIIYNGKFISAYRRTPLTVIGDGDSIIEEILNDKIYEYRKSQRKMTLEMDKIISVLKRQKMSLRFMPERGQRVQLLDNANLSAGGYAEDVTHEINAEYKQTAIDAAKDLGLILSGVDLMIQGDISQKPKKGKWFFLELNASPGFHNYSELGEKQYERIERLFRKMITDIKNGKTKF